jgi:hypothetical protein
MDRPEAVLAPAERQMLRPQEPPDRFAERVMRSVASHRRRARRRLAAAAGAALVLAAAASVAVTLDRGSGHGEIRAGAREEVRAGPHVIAALEPGAHIAWDGDDVKQLSGNVFYRVDRGGIHRVQTAAGTVTVHGTCFDVKVRTDEEGPDMTRRDAVAGAVGALAAATVLVGVYEGKVTLTRANASVDVASGQGARADAHGIHGPEDLAVASKAFEAPSSDPWRVANAGLADQVKVYQHRLEDSQAQTKTIAKEIEKLKARLASSDRDAAVSPDPFNPTQEQWKELAKAGIVRAKNFCFPPPDWHPDGDQLGALGLAPGDGPVLDRALAAASQRMWQAIGPACAKIVGSAEVAERLGNETCGTIIQSSVSSREFSAATQLVADVRAGNRPMPPPGQTDPVTARLLAMTSAGLALEKDLNQDFGPEAAHRIAFGDTPWSCALQFGGEGTSVSPQLGNGTQ